VERAQTASGLFFDVQGIVPAGYALFATALGIAAGMLLRRTLSAIAIVLAGFVCLRLVFTQFIRQHYMTAVTAYYSPLANFTPSGSSWALSQGFVSKQGQVFTGESVGAILVNGVPSCLVRGAPLSTAQFSALSCMRAHGFRGFTTYQPASRYWAFQGIETGIFVALAAALLALAFIVGADAASCDGGAWCGRKGPASARVGASTVRRVLEGRGRPLHMRPFPVWGLSPPTPGRPRLYHLVGVAIC
jgi:hypothetical protein